MKILFVSTYPPTKCGIATYTAHLRAGIMQGTNLKEQDLPVLSIYPETWQGDDHHIYPLPKHNEKSYTRAAHWVNASDIDIVSLQHEFGIFGGHAGEWIIPFLETLKKPVVTTFHTVFPEETLPYTPVQNIIAQRSDGIIVMNRLAIRYISELFHIPQKKIYYIPHGAPEPLRIPRQQLKQKWGVEGRKVLLTFGLLSPGKGIEYALDVLKDVARDVPDVLYLIAGQTHPEVKKRQGEAYRHTLIQRIETLGIGAHVRMIDRFLSEEELTELLTISDVYVSPYPGMAQITSGTLAYAVGLGRPVIATPYTYARDLLRDFPELLVPYGDTKTWKERLIELLIVDTKREALERKMMSLGRTMRWSVVGKRTKLLLERYVRQKEAMYSHG